MRSFLVVLLLFAILAIPVSQVRAMVDTAECYNASFYKWQNISANLACFMSIIMNDSQIDWESGNTYGDVL